MNQSELEANTCNQRQAREKRVGASRDWIEFYFGLVEKMVRVFLVNHRAK